MSDKQRINIRNIRNYSIYMQNKNHRQSYNSLIVGDLRQKHQFEN